MILHFLNSGRVFKLKTQTQTFHSQQYPSTKLQNNELQAKFLEKNIMYNGYIVHQNLLSDIWKKLMRSYLGHLPDLTCKKSTIFL